MNKKQLDRIIEIRHLIRLNKDIIKFSNSPHERDIARYDIKKLIQETKDIRKNKKVR